MIYVTFVYKNTAVLETSVDMEYTDHNKAAVYDDIIHGSITRPENYERVLLTREKLKNTLWVGSRQ